MRFLVPVLAAISISPSPARTLEQSFIDPPASARPHVWWHWMNGNITKQGITLDLEAMARVGIGGAQIFNVANKKSCNVPKGPVDYLSPEFFDLVQHASTEAKRLDIELCLHNCPGWSSSGGPWIDPAHSMQLLVSSEIQTTTAGTIRLPQPETRMRHYREIAVIAFPTPADSSFRIPDLAALTTAALKYQPATAAIAAPAEAMIPRDKVIDLSQSLHKDGSINWNPPSPGSWTIVRLGHTSSGKTNHPAPDSATGLECDKLSRAAMDLHWARGIQPILDRLGPAGSHAVNNLLVDSYEVGPNTWTPEFRAEFTKRRGYDPLLMLPVLAGHLIGNGEQSSRFLWDYRRTIADMFADNYYAYFAELCHKAGYLASVEPYDGPFECLANGRDYDIIMGEFWTNSSAGLGHDWQKASNHYARTAASVAHVNGTNIVGAESFTSGPPNGRWQNHPGMLKQPGDAMWCLGVNRFIFHRYAHQPWPADVVPGMTMGQWGTHFDRTNTWWEPSRAWIQYITRSQFLLQQGRFAADVLFFGGENVPTTGVTHHDLKRDGYDYDSIGTDMLQSLQVADGEIVLPGGMRYKLLVLPEERTMTPGLARKLLGLVEAGATLLGTKPLRSPGLAAGADQETRAAADQLWGEEPLPSATIRQVGKGRVLQGVTPKQALELLQIPPQVVAPQGIHWIQRSAPGRQIFLLSNQSAKSFHGEIGFRVSGMAPSLFDPNTGSVANAMVWNTEGSSTSVTLSLAPAGSIFVVFEAKDGASAKFGNHTFEALSQPQGKSGPGHKLVIHSAKYGARNTVDLTSKLAAMVKDGELDIQITNDFAGQDPSPNTSKTLQVEYSLDGKPSTTTINENQRLVLPSGLWKPVLPLPYVAEGRGLVSFAKERHAFTKTDGSTLQMETPDPPAPIQLSGPWEVTFQPKRGAPQSTRFEHLMSLHEHEEPGIRYFSGTAVWKTSFDVTSLPYPNQEVHLDLGRVEVIAGVNLNGSNLGILWLDPFRIDVTKHFKVGTNTLEVAVTNLWVNRLIGDEQLPPDVQWSGKALGKWPEWLGNEKLRQARDRVTFTTWHHWNRQDALKPSGLIGPVLLRYARIMPLP